MSTEMTTDSREPEAREEKPFPLLARPTGWKPNLTDEQRKRLEDFSRSNLGSLASLPVICTWNDCIFRHGCELWQLQVSPPPLSLPCPIEASKVVKYLNEIREEMKIGDRDITDLSIAREVVFWMIIEDRALAELALDPKNIRESVVGYDQDAGEPITKEVSNPIIAILEKAGRMKAKLRDALLATREAKSKDKGRQQVDPSVWFESMTRKIEERQRRMAGTATATIVETVTHPKLEHRTGGTQPGASGDPNA